MLLTGHHALSSKLPVASVRSRGVPAWEGAGYHLDGWYLREAETVAETEARFNNSSRNMRMPLAYDHQGLRGIQAVYDIRLGRINSIRHIIKFY